MSIVTQTITTEQVGKILALPEDHFADLKAIEVAPAKLTTFLSAFANTDGGELYIGVDEDKAAKRRVWRGFSSVEAANGHLQALEKFFPLGTYCQYTFLEASGESGLVLRAEIQKTPDVRAASDGHFYIRRGAQRVRLVTPDEVKRLEFVKGVRSFEDERTAAPLEVVTNSTEIIAFMLAVVPTSEPEAWLAKQLLIRDAAPVVASVLLFAEEPQAILPKRSGVKIHRYKTTEASASRETMAFDPLTVEGSLYRQIDQAVALTKKLIQETRALGVQGLEEVQYPPEALHEVITNAVIHRDYSAADDVHIRIFDNRVEVESPGQLPAHITPQNILKERFARNGKIVRLLNKFPNPPNKDVGEGLNTAFAAMRRLGLKAPQIENREHSVVVVLRHERLASYEIQVLEYLETHDTIKNKEGRDLCHVDADYKMRRVFSRLEKRDLIQKVPDTTQALTAYTKGPKFQAWRTTLNAGELAELSAEPAENGEQPDADEDNE